MDLRGDLRMAFRQLSRRPAFSLTCIAVLALGLGATTAIFSALYAAVLKPLPYPDPDALVAVHNRFPQLHLPRLGMSTLDYVDLRDHHELFASIGVYYFLDLSRTGVERPAKVNAVAASSSLFDTLRITPILGRNFNAEEERYRGPHAVILSEGYWKSQFGGDPNVLERSLQLNGELYRVAGIMPGSFAFPNKVTEMWVPAVFSPKMLEPQARQSHWLRMVARLAAGVDFDASTQRIEELSRSMSRQHPEDYPLDRLGWRFFVLPLAKDDDGSLRYWLYILFAAAACLLLIVCSNVAGLLLVRSTECRFELSLRLALGASRFRIARQVFAEVMVLAVLGGVAALWIAHAAVGLLAAYKQTADARLELPVYLFLFGSSMLTGAVCGLYPAWLATRTIVARSLKEGGHQRTAGGSQQRLRFGLIVGQVAVATALLVCGGLLIRSLVRLLETSSGFDAHNVLAMQVSLPRLRYGTPVAWGRFYETLLDRIRRTPGVEAASACTLLPFGYGENANTFEIVGRPKPLVEPFANLNNVMPDFFETMRIPLLKGRLLNWRDRDRTQPVTLIDETMAKRYFPGQDPIGQQVQMPWDKPFTIVGVVGSVKTAGLDVASRPTLYFNALQFPSSDMSLVVRSPLSVELLTSGAQRAVAEIDKDQPVYDVVPLQVRIDKSLETRRLVVSLILVFAGSGTLLAALGLYGLLSYTVALRRREIGIRMVLGADKRAIASAVARSGFSMAAAGILVGVATATAAAQFIQSQLYGIGIRDALTWFMVPALILLTSLLACVVPAWRAAHVDPMASLREE